MSQSPSVPAGRNVLTLPIGVTSDILHDKQVYSIQAHRLLVEPLCQNPDLYIAFREARGGHMTKLYQVVSPPDLILNPQQPLLSQLEQLSMSFSSAEKRRLIEYMQETTKRDPQYRATQRYYLLREVRTLKHKPRPTINGQNHQWYSLETLLNNRIL